MSEHQKLLVIVGPTSSGKTKLAVDLAREFDGEIVSADSRQVYRGMDIGTGKDLCGYSSQFTVHSSQHRVPYHLIDIVSPRTNFTLAQYQKRAYQVIDDILARGKLPILVGGTGLYIQAIVDGYVLPQASPNPVLRKKLAALSISALCVKLKKLDPATYRVIDKHNRRRLERAIEICLATGAPLSKQRVKHPPLYDVLMLGLAVPKTELHRRIDKRLQERLKQGMVEEVERLHKQGILWKRLESFGLEYRYVSRYLRNTAIASHAKVHDRELLRDLRQTEYKKMSCELSRAIKGFARRQITWFKRDKRIKWVSDKKEAERLVKKFLS